MSYHYVNSNKREKAVRLAEAILSFVDAEVWVNSSNYSQGLYPEEELEAEENLKQAEKELFDRFYIQTKCRLYRVGGRYYVDGILVRTK